MKYPTNNNHAREHQQQRRKLLGLLGITLLAGSGDMFGKEKKKPAIDPEHGKEFEKNGQKFRVFVVAGIRFVTPASYNIEQANSDGKPGFHVDLFWPDIPPRKAPIVQGTKLSPDEIANRRVNSVLLQVHERREGSTGDIDTYESLEQRGQWTSSDYISRDDLALGLRVFARKNVPNELNRESFFREGYSLNNEVLTPHFRKPVVVQGNYIHFIYAPSIRVRVIMSSAVKGLNPNWKGIYLGIVETLNNYREEGKK